MSAGELKERGGGHASDADLESLEEVFAAELADHLQAVSPQLALLASAATRAVAREQLQRVFHTIKGTAALVGRPEIADAALRLERFFARPVDEPADQPGGASAQAALDELFAAVDADAPSLAEASAAGVVAAAADGELREAFALDASETFQHLDESLLRLERRPGDGGAIEEMLRRMHSLKGAAAAAGLAQVGAAIHDLESLLEAGGEGAGDAAWVEKVFGLADEIRGRIDGEIGTELGRVARTAGEEGSADRDAGAVRIPMRELDALVDLTAQLVVNRVQMEQRMRSFADLREKLQGCRRRLAATAEGFDRRLDDRRWEKPQRAGNGNGNGDGFFTELELDKYDDVTVLSRSLIETASDAGEIADEVARLVERLAEQARHFSRVTSNLQHQITGLRRVPMESVFRRLQRPLRDAAQSVGKSIELAIEGADVALDRAVVEALYAPLLHLVRNSVAHGIEAPADRRARGKRETGTVSVGATLCPDGVAVEVRDDGAGFDLDAVAARARRAGLFADRDPSREELVGMLFRHGFSTGDGLSELAGRGVGLDVVAREVRALDGRIEVETRPGEGSTVRMLLPVSSSIDEALILEVGSQALAVPVRWVEQALPVEMAALAGDGERRFLTVRGVRVPLLAMGPWIGEPPPADAGVAVVLRSPGAAWALLVDRVRAQQEIAVRALDPLLAGHPLLSGWAIAGTGAVVFVLQISRLAEWSGVGIAPAPRAPLAAAALPAARAHAVLVVDDSISVRKLAARFLESAGVEVVTAVDGMDALEKLSQERFRAVVTDLEMPRMNGYELIGEIRRHPRWQNLPIIVCTSRSGEKHRRRAREMGAEGYVTKPFTREALVGELARLGATSASPVAAARDEESAADADRERARAT